MARITQADLCDAVKDTLAEATTLARAESYDELSEDPQDLPCLQVYPEMGRCDASGQTDRRTLRAGLRQSETEIVADVYARQRSEIKADMAAVVNNVDAIEAILEAQDTKAYFGLDGIKAFSWRWERATLVTSGHQYAGARFTITLTVF